MSLATGEYVIVNKQTGKALDANVDAAMHMSHEHKRPFMWDKNSNAPNHKWLVEKQYNGNYLLKTRHNNNERALDGNTNAPQKQNSHPQPFLWTPVPSAANHRWVLKPVGTEHNTFLIVNEANNLALDGNVNAIGHHDHRYQSPFLYTETYHAPNHHWIFQAVTPVTPGKYMIVNKQTGQALDANINAPRHLSHEHKRPFMWTATPTAENHYWNLQHINADEFLITSNFPGHEIALDGNTNVPQHTHTHPSPFVYQPVPSAANHRWKFVVVPHEPNTFYILNAANGLALDGNVNGGSHHDHAHQAPFLWQHVPSALNHKWELRPYGQYNNNTTTSYQPQTTHHQVDVQVGNFISSAFGMFGNAMNNAQQQQHQQHQQQQPYPTHQQVYQVPQQPSFHQPNMHVHVTPNVPYQIHQHQPQQHIHHQPQIHHHQPQQHFTSGAMDHNAFQQFLVSLKKEAFESGRKNLLSTIATHNWFTCDQLSQIIKMLSFSSEKVFAATVIVPRIVDKQNSHMVISSMTFSSEKDEVTKLFQRY
jgi:hypothetical protein